MVIVHPDFARCIDLPGAGPCPRPIDIDRSETGFSELVALRVYSFARGKVIEGEAEDDELFVVLMRGAADIVVTKAGQEAGAFALRHGGGLRAIYMPPHAAYTLTAVADCDIAYARAEPRGQGGAEVCGFASEDGRLDAIGHATAMDLALATVAAGADAAAAIGDDAAERFVHVRANGAITATAGDEALGDWDSLALNKRESIMVKIEMGAADVLTVSTTKAGPA